jgi:POT family proton-dependent oligopeptide transporter
MANRAQENATMANAQTAEKPSFPPQIKYIIGNEAAERFSFYGMKTILFVFMTEYLRMTNDDAGGIYHTFVTWAYVMPLVGAFLSDRFWGKYRTIMILSMGYCLGHLVLALWENRDGLVWGLALIAIGAGGIKPCVSAHVGDQFNEKNSSLIDKVFSLFYFSINFGAFFSSLATPILLKQYGPSIAFGIPGVLMALATLIFWMGRKEYVHVPPAGKTGKKGFLTVFLYALRNRAKRKPGQELLDVAREKYSAEEVEGSKAVLPIFRLFILVSAFWALFDQTGSAWVEQAKKMDPVFMGVHIEASQMQALNPAMVMVMIPLFSMWLYPAVERAGVRVTALRKMSVGMIFTTFSFIASAVIQQMIDAGAVLNIGWQFVPYLLITAAEILVSISGLEFAYTQAPRAMKSTIMSFWMLTVAVGNYFVVLIIGAGEALRIPTFSPTYYYFFAAMMFVVGLVFAWGASRFKVRDFVERSNPAVEPDTGLINAPNLQPSTT